MFLSWLGAPLPPALHSNLIRAAAANKGSTQLEIVLWQQYSIFHPNWHVLCLATSCNRGRARPRLQAGNKTLFMSKRNDLEKKFNGEDVLRKEENLCSPLHWSVCDQLIWSQFLHRTLNPITAEMRLSPGFNNPSAYLLNKSRILIPFEISNQSIMYNRKLHNSLLLILLTTRL